MKCCIIALTSLTTDLKEKQGWLGVKMTQKKDKNLDSSVHLKSIPDIRVNKVEQIMIDLYMVVNKLLEFFLLCYHYALYFLPEKKLELHD